MWWSRLWFVTFPLCHFYYTGASAFENCMCGASEHASMYSRWNLLCCCDWREDIYLGGECLRVYTDSLSPRPSPHETGGGESLVFQEKAVDLRCLNVYFVHCMQGQSCLWHVCCIYVHATCQCQVRNLDILCDTGLKQTRDVYRSVQTIIWGKKSS